MDKLQEILEDLEKEAQAKRSIITNTYNNQPELISISSDNAVITTQNATNDAYYSFTCNLIRPAIGVKSIQLLKANIPQATALSFTNGELLFPYYRIKTQENLANEFYFSEEPNIDNLYYVRLLPSYYPPNIIPNAQLYGFNKTFNNYTELSTELAKACANDLLYTNLTTPHFIPNDVLISYNSDYNKFQFEGNNTTTSWTPPTYTLNPASIVQENKLVTYQSQEYLSLENSNSVNPALIIYAYTSGQVFYKFNIALYSGSYYTCVVSEVSNILPTNTTYWTPSTYNPAVNYGGTLIGFNVYYNNYWYVSITNATNTGQTPGSSPLFWRLQPYSSGGVTPGPPNPVIMTAPSWSGTFDYLRGNVVRYIDDLFYIAKFGNTNITPINNAQSSVYWDVIANTAISTSLTTYPPDNWTAEADYNFNDITKYNGLIYIQIYAGLINGYVPSNSPSIWQPFSLYHPTKWVGSGFQYYAQEIVLWTDGNIYTCIASNNNITPTGDANSALYWILSGWSSATNYSTKSPQGGAENFPVLYDGKWYSSTSLTPNQNRQPDTNYTYWNGGPTATINTGVMNWWQVYTGTTGFTYLIAGFQDPNVLLLQEDINEGVNGDNPDFFYGLYGLNNIVSIPTPPVSPGKTLAKRLGFSWNGLYTWPGTNEVAPIQYPQGSSLPIFWNRFRPIPPYELIPEELGDIPIPNNNPFTSTTYIAENYCNLVYTSILSIISNITTASTLDSTNRRNILWLLPMNCGQLGISFSDAYIDTGLTKINNDIYQINIELRNELDEPFYISNNGISTFLLKLTY
jgi:hypothetical protein